MFPRIFFFVVLTCTYALDNSPQGQADVAQVLSKCLGRDTLLRWQRQLVAASRYCGGEALLVQEDPVPVPGPGEPPTAAPSEGTPAGDATVVQDNQQPDELITPLTIVPSNQPFIPSQSFPFYFQKLTFPYFLSAPLPHHKYYFINAPQSATTDTVVPSQQVNVPVTNAQKTTPNSGFPFVQNVPGFSKPIVQYYPVRKPGDNQYFYQPFQAQGSEQAGVVAVPQPAAGEGQRRVITHDQTFTDPGLKFEQTEQYHREQQILAALRQDSVRQQEASQSSSKPFRGGIGRPLIAKQKREAEALSVFTPATSATFREWPTSPDAEKFSRERHMRVVRSRAAERLGNMTCIMKAMKALTDDLEPNHDFITNSLLELPVSHDVYEEFKSSQEYCRKYSQCLPERKKINGIEMSHNLSKAFEFFRCFGKEKVRVCLQSDSVTLADMLNRNLVPRDTVFFPRYSKLGQTLGEVDQLLNGAGSQFLDLVLL